MGFDLLLAPKCVSTGVGFNLGAIQRHPFPGDQSFSTQHPHPLHKHAIERVLVIRTESRQSSMTNRLQTAQPLERRLKLTSSRNLTRRADPPTVRIQP